jgi:hypothetical protein
MTLTTRGGKTKRVKTKKKINRGGCLWCGEGTGESIFNLSDNECHCGQYRPTGKRGSVCQCGHGEIWHDRENKLETLVKNDARQDSRVSILVNSLQDRIQQLQTEIDNKQQLAKDLVTEKKDLQEKVDDLKDKLEQRCDDDITVCIICLKENRSVLYLPCSHAQYCKECSERWLEQSNKCPVCRGTVEAQLDIIL